LLSIIVLFGMALLFDRQDTDVAATSQLGTVFCCVAS
jgi:hypothetical protein